METSNDTDLEQCAPRSQRSQMPIQSTMTSKNVWENWRIMKNFAWYRQMELCLPDQLWQQIFVVNLMYIGKEKHIWVIASIRLACGYVFRVIYWLLIDEEILSPLGWSPLHRWGWAVQESWLDMSLGANQNWYLYKASTSNWCYGFDALAPLNDEV